jgi:hypothetical protein
LAWAFSCLARTNPEKSRFRCDYQASASSIQEKHRSITRAFCVADLRGGNQAHARFTTARKTYKKPDSYMCIPAPLIAKRDAYLSFSEAK